MTTGHAQDAEQPETGITPGDKGAFRDVLSKDHARRGKPPVHLVDMTPDERVARAKDLGLPKFRVKQLANHYFGRLETESEAFTDLPAATRGDIVEAFFPPLIDEVTHQVADQGTTIKTLWRLFDGSHIESVLMRYPNRTTLCISSQVGCGMGCPFCATGKLGLTRNMSTGEILEQVRVAARMMRDGEVAGGPGRLSNIVFMGMGEPMGNYRSVLSAVRQISAMSPEGFGISARNITVSTVGVVPGIRKLAAEGIPVRLAVSLHAPSDALRDELVPMNKRFNTTQVLDAAHDYFLSSKRRVSIEYALMRGINDQAEHARLLAKRLNHYGDDWAHVNPSRSTRSRDLAGPHPSPRMSSSSSISCTMPESRPPCVTPEAPISTAPAASSPPRPKRPSRPSRALTAAGRESRTAEGAAFPSHVTGRRGAAVTGGRYPWYPYNNRA